MAYSEGELASFRDEYARRLKEAADAARNGDNSLDQQLTKDRESGVLGPEVQKAYQDQVNGVEGTNVVTEQADKKYQSPGAADFGGYNAGGEDYKNHFLGGMKNNDVLQKQTDDAMNFSLGQMRGDRGPMAVENGRLAGREAQSRGQQQDALNMSMKAALGEAPSQAQGQTTQAMNGLMGSRATAMGGARGLSALTGAGLGGSAMGAQAGNIAAQGGFGRSQEIGQDMGQYGQLAGAARGQDLSRLGQNSQMSNFNADLNDAWKLGQGQNAVNAGKVGNSLDLSDQQYYGASMQPAEAQLQADQAMKGIEQGAETDKAAIGYSKAADKRKSESDLYKGLGGSVVTGGGTMIGGPVGGMAANAGFNAATSRM